MDTYYHYIDLWLSDGASEPGTVLLLGGLSFLLGLTHTLGPGHGKSLLLGVLVAESRRIGHALKMAAVIGITHMADVILLALVSIIIVASFSFSAISTVIGWVSGVALIGIGGYRLWETVETRNGDAVRIHGEDEASCEHDHHTEHETENLWAAFFYSLAPCPGAWVLFTACLGLGKPVYGLYLLGGFTLGLLTMISLIAVSIVYSTQWLDDWIPDWTGHYVSMISGLIIVVLGIWIIVSTVLNPAHLH